MKKYFAALLVLITAAGCNSAASAVVTSTPPEKTAAPAPTVTPAPPTETKDGALFIGYHNGRNELKQVDLATGQLATSTTPIVIGDYPMVALSADDRQMAVFNYPNNRTPDDGNLQLIDTRTLEAHVIEGVSFPSMVNTLAFSPDSKRLLVTYFVMESPSLDSPISEYHIALVDLAQEKVVADGQLNFSPNLLHWSPDGASIAIYGVRYNTYGTPAPETPEVVLLDGADLSVLWTTRVEGLHDGNYAPEGTPSPNLYASIMWVPASAFSADVSKLYLVHADEDKLTTVDFAARSITTVAIVEQKSFFERMMELGAGVAHAKAIRGNNLNGTLSADGPRMFVTGTKMDYTIDSKSQVEFTNTSVGLRVIDVATGVLLQTLDFDLSGISLSQDGGQLFLHHYDKDGVPSTQVLDATSLQPIATIPDFEVYPPLLILDSGRLALPAVRWGFNSETTLAVIDAKTFKVISQWDDDASSNWVLVTR